MLLEDRHGVADKHRELVEGGGVDTWVSSMISTQRPTI
jgi:hypothetical protein